MMAEQRSLDFEPGLKDSGTRTAERLAHAEGLKRQAEQAVADARSIGFGDAAESAFAEAEKVSIKCTDMETQMLAFESSGDFYNARKAFVTASKKYEIALQNAQCLSGTSDAAGEALYRLRFKLLSIQKRGDKALKNLRDITQAMDTYEAIWKAWHSYVHDIQYAEGRLAARGLGSKDDFRRRLEAAKLDFSDENEE